MKKDNLSRRNFLKTTGLTSSALFALSPLEIFFGSLLQGICDKALAVESNSSGVVNYIHLSLLGGVPRWMFDLPLRPNGSSDPFYLNEMIISKITNSNSQTTDYSLMKHGNFYFPHFWNSKTASVNGGERDVKELLNNLLTFRGVNLLADGHGLNRIKQVTPVPGGVSLSGLAADKSNAPFPGIHYGSSLGFKSKSGLGAVNVTTGNPISKLLEPFGVSNARSFGRNGDDVENMISRTLASMKKMGDASPNSSKKLFSDTANSKKLFETEFGNLTDVFNQLFNKYENLIRESIALNDLQGVDASSVISQNSGRFGIQSNDVYRIAPGIDLRDTLIRNSTTLGSEGLSLSHGDTTISSLATNMALAEYVVVNGLSSSISIQSGNMSNLSIPVISNNVVTRMNNRIVNNDAHATGAIPTMFYFSKYYKALCACLLELTDQMKAKSSPQGGNVFQNSIIHISSEFNRSARASGTGSDHGWAGSNASIISGMVESPMVVGNVKANYSPGGAYSGTWGVAGEVDDLSGRETLIGNVASSISTILGTSSPTPNDQSFVGVKNGKVVNYASKPKNV